MNKIAKTLLSLSLVMVSGAIVASTSGQVREKARYYYMEGVRCMSEDRPGEAYEYFKKAYRLDPDYKEAASLYGTSRLMIEIDTLQSEAELDRSLALMKSFVDAYPNDFFESQYYAYVTSRMGDPDEAIRVFERMDSLRPDKTGTLLHLAEAYMGKNDGKKALDVLTRYENIEGKNPQITLRKITLHLMDKDTVAAVKEVDDLIASNPAEPVYRILKGNLYDIAGKRDSVEYYYKEAERIAPNNGAAKLTLANYYKEHGDSALYDAKTYEALLSEDFSLEDKGKVLAEYLQKLFNDKSDTARGDHLFEVLRDEYPHEPTVLDLAARYSAAKGDFKDAVEQISYAIDLSPETEAYWGQLMSYEIADDKYQKAMDTYTRALDHIAPTEGLKLMYAQAAMLDGDTDKAVDVYGALINESSPGLDVRNRITDMSVLQNLSYDQLVRISALFTMIGDVEYNKENIEAAFNAYENALFFNPENVLALNNYAYFMTVKGIEPERAEEMSRKAVSMQPDNSTYLDTLAWVLFKKGDYKEAKEYQTTAIEKAEQEGEVPGELYDHFGDILFMSGDPVQAVECWEKALKDDPDNALLKKKVSHKTFFWE